MALAKLEASGFLGACGTKGFRLPARLGQKGLRKLIDGEMVDGWCWARWAQGSKKGFEMDKYKWKPRTSALMKVRFGGFEC